LKETPKTSSKIIAVKHRDSGEFYSQFSRESSGRVGQAFVLGAGYRGLVWKDGRVVAALLRRSIAPKV
jgi:hypothetical protein